MKNYNERIKSIQKKAKRMKAVQFTVKTTATLLMIAALVVSMSVFGPHLLKQLRSMFIPTGDILGQPSTVPSTTVDPLPEIKYDSFRVTEEERACLGVSPSDQVIRLYTADIDVEMGRFDTIPDAGTLFTKKEQHYRFYMVCHENGQISQKTLEYFPEGGMKPVNTYSDYLSFWRNFYLHAKQPENIFPFPVTVNYVYFDFEVSRPAAYIYFETDCGNYILYGKSTKTDLYLFPAEIFYEISKAFVARLNATVIPGEGGGQFFIEQAWNIEPYKIGVKQPPQLLIDGVKKTEYASARSASWTYNDQALITSAPNILDPTVDIKNDIPWLRLDSSTLPLQFTVEPDEITVLRWRVEDFGKRDAYEKSEKVIFFDNYVLSRRGTYIYEITATWNNVSGSSGSATYAFVAEWPDPETGSLEFELLADDTYGVRAGDNFRLTDVVIPSTYNGIPVTQILPKGFMKCDLQSISIPDSITTIGEIAFQGCSGLTTIELPDSVTNIGELAFSHCKHLISITLPKNITTISYGTFMYCENLTSIIIPDGVTSIGKMAFVGCKNLTDIYLPASISAIGTKLFQFLENYVNLQTIHYSGTMEQWQVIWKAGDWDNGTYDYTVYCVDGNVAKGYTIGTEILFFEMLEDGTYGVGAWHIQKPLEIVIPSTHNGIPVTKILKGAFYNTNIVSVTIPDSIITIGEKAFFSCSYLSTVILSKNLQTIGTDAFGYCQKLTTIMIPGSVTSIGGGAFDLKEVYFDGSMAQWNVISKKYNWNTSTSEYTIYCTDGEIKKSS